MNNRQNKKRNRKKHLNIVSKLPFTLEKIVYGSGYFIFTFGESVVSWFWLKEFPDWKFGIWLSPKGFQIFGEATVLIDKFKPSYTKISETSTLSFIEELDSLQCEFCYGDYLTIIEEEKQYQAKKIKEDREIYSTLFNACRNLSNDEVRIKITDRHTKHSRILPRYIIDEYVRDDYIYSPEGTIQSVDNYRHLCESLANVDFDVESFRDTYVFSPLSIMVYSPKEYEYNAKTYKWDSNTFEDYLQKVLNNNQDWEIEKDQLKNI